MDATEHDDTPECHRKTAWTNGMCGHPEAMGGRTLDCVGGTQSLGAANNYSPQQPIASRPRNRAFHHLSLRNDCKSRLSRRFFNKYSGVSSCSVVGIHLNLFCTPHPRESREMIDDARREATRYLQSPKCRWDVPTRATRTRRCKPRVAVCAR